MKLAAAELKPLRALLLMPVRVGVAVSLPVLLFCLENCDVKYMMASLNGKVQLITLLLFHRTPILWGRLHTGALRLTGVIWSFS